MEKKDEREGGDRMRGAPSQSKQSGGGKGVVTFEKRVGKEGWARERR